MERFPEQELPQLLFQHPILKHVPRVQLLHVKWVLASVDGGETWTYVGVGPTIIATPGRLLLVVNDCLSGLSDNSGFLDVTIDTGVGNE